jgi:hypothetical protein
MVMEVPVSTVKAVGCCQLRLTTERIARELGVTRQAAFKKHHGG